MDTVEKHLEGIKRVLVDEQIGGTFANTIKQFFEKQNIVIKFISLDQELKELKGKTDPDVCRWAKEHDYDAIVTEDVPMIYEAISQGLAVFQARHFDNHKRLWLLRIYKITGWRQSIIED